MRVSVDEACSRLRRGEVVAIPTETVYGLAAPLHNLKSIQRIFELKRRPSDNPLIIHLADVSDLKEQRVQTPPSLDRLTDLFWPGPLTLVLPIDPTHIPAIARAQLPTAAFRIPNHSVAQEIARRVGPLVAPSANLSGRPSATTVEHVEEDFGTDFPIVDGGMCQEGVESTILIYVDACWQVARLGVLSSEQFEVVLGYRPQLYTSTQKNHPPILCPGQHYRHYAPLCKLILGNARYDGQPDVVVGYEDRLYPGAKEVLYLGTSTHPNQVSHNLYQVLRQLDQKGIAEAWIDLNIPSHGLWETIAERLSRASY